MYDIKHKTACLLKHDLENDASWQEFVGEVNRFKQRVSVTPLACLLPPQQRGKARYMNVDVLVDWAEKNLTLLDRPDVLAQVGLDAAVVEEKLGWLREYAPQVRRWREMLEVMETTEHYVRHQGIHRKAAEELAVLLPKPRSEPARSLREQLLEFVQEEAQQARKGERLLGSSEVLESIIGKFKCVAGERGQHGLTGMVLSIGALVGHVTVETVQAALAEVPNQRRLELVSNASWPHAARPPPTDHASPRHGTKTETITPGQNLALSPTQSRPFSCEPSVPGRWPSSIRKIRRGNSRP